MTQKIPLLIFMLLVKASLDTGQGLIGCIPGYYVDNNTCNRCPDQCETCISDNNCTTCERKYYGQTCELTCDVMCEGPCHKTHGHCTYGCRDGSYSGPFDLGCYDCPTNCKLCVSPTSCILCQSGNYGPICQDVCQQNCVSSCHKDYGHCTHGCQDGTYHTDNDTCLICPVNCEVCTSKTGCLRCKPGMSLDAHSECNQDTEVESTVLKVMIPTATVILVFCILAVGLVIYYRSKFTAREDSESQAAEVGDGKNSTGLLDETQWMKEHNNNI